MRLYQEEWNLVEIESYRGRRKTIDSVTGFANITYSSLGTVLYKLKFA